MIWYLMLLPLVLVLSALQPTGCWRVLEFCPSCCWISHGPGSALQHSPFLRLGFGGPAVSASLFCSSLPIALIREDRFEVREILAVGEDLSFIWLLFSFKVLRTSGCFQGQTLSWPVAGSVPDLAAVQVARISLGWIVLVGNNVSNVLGKKKAFLFMSAVMQVLLSQRNFIHRPIYCGGWVKMLSGN